MKNRRSTRFCLPLACLLALTACTPGGDAAEPAPVSVPPPVEQTNTELHIFYTDADAIQTSTLDAAVTQYNQRHPDNPVTAEKIFTDGSDTVRDEQTRRMLAEVMAGEGPDLIFFVDDSMDVEKMARGGRFVWQGRYPAGGAQSPGRSMSHSSSASQATRSTAWGRAFSTARPPQSPARAYSCGASAAQNSAGLPTRPPQAAVAPQVPGTAKSSRRCTVAARSSGWSATANSKKSPGASGPAASSPARMLALCPCALCGLGTARAPQAAAACAMAGVLVTTSSAASARAAQTAASVCRPYRYSGRPRQGASSLSAPKRRDDPAASKMTWVTAGRAAPCRLFPA